MTDQSTTAGEPRDADRWNAMYESRRKVFSGEPNGVLVAEVTDLPPGQALDVGCGEGADALWLARRGWLVTAVDISQVALKRAAAAGSDLAERIAWAHADLAVVPPPVAAFDLVSVQYFPIPRDPAHTPLPGLLAAVATGGTLLVVSHDFADLPPDRDLDPRDYYQPADIADLLTDDWTIQVNETRPRPGTPPEGTHHTRDTVLRARRAR
ncbi:class I SAM-dependent methyltransferase [Spiractinospora alimapuensis]|uniref:class I SAM-dependent methyltransferase n=1 Tax=Spiractinospora alimapuensis TaxID=2820884 RepID=UPI001F3EC445|nr:class I SAM-dependent methyltransferase [Spiractinospora alimapuensis]QVQ54121.1 class I SAM-dependent methyltransferase [Spiractinospora alimapuensis]